MHHNGAKKMMETSNKAKQERLYQERTARFAAMMWAGGPKANKGRETK